MNGDDQKFFTKLFVDQAKILGRLEIGQEALKEDVVEVKDNVKKMKKKIEDECMPKTQVEEFVGSALSNHYIKEHDPEKRLGHALLTNKEKIWRVGLIVLSIFLTLLGVSAAAGGF